MWKRMWQGVAAAGLIAGLAVIAGEVQSRQDRIGLTRLIAAQAVADPATTGAIGRRRRP